MKLLAVLLLTVTLLGCGVTAPSSGPGYVQFNAPTGAGLERDTHISLGPRVLRFAARHVDDDPSTKALLKSLDGVRVNVSRLGPGADYLALRDELTLTADASFGAQWNPVVRVAEDDSSVHIFISEEAGIIRGLAVLALDHEELVFVNIMGEISPEQIARLSSVVPHGEALAFGGAE